MSQDRPTRRRLPPLNALRAFEAVARSLSFTKAADQLLVTQSAVSRQVKNLEDILGVQLLKRKGPLELTEEGRKLLSSQHLAVLEPAWTSNLKRVPPLLRTGLIERKLTSGPANGS